MRIAFLLLALAAAPLPAAAEAARVDRIDVVDKGIYEIVTGSQTPNASTPTGTVTAVTTEKLLAATASVPAKVGVEFGFRYIIVGGPAGAEVPLDIDITYPPPGLKDPAAAAPVLTSQYSPMRKIGEPIYLGYGLETDWEVVPGTWTFTISHAGKKLAEESFTLATP